MKVSSPIGDLPFEPQRIAIKARRVEISGVMGAWPAHVQIDVKDLPALVRILAKPAGVAVATAALLVGLRRLTRPRP
ncbi:hypothetical protein HC031_26550 [Planosporangium thailandense]|uniref:Uncharacterized protein n=1 Tax=Planosporangium thailandense TaxID=765197 RepID=A0ABX0Y533_9ACTN|nr:hypothetical protein [Planosporangium thailandense]NJC73252.1 hypothetical protein [Planosporangium thailandense]